MSETMSFEDQINAHRLAESVSPEVAAIATPESALDVRLRGAFITRCELTSPTTGDRVAVLYSDPDLTVPKLTATHPMVPAGPYDGLGGQHGYPRWADYHAFPPTEDPTGEEQQLSLRAIRSERGLIVDREFGLTGGALAIHTTVTNQEQTPEQTSMGEHCYFALEDGNLETLKVDGKSIDELLGEGSTDVLKDSGTLFYGFDGQTTLDFPAGHSVRLSAEFAGESQYPPALWIWKRAGSPSICFEPVVGMRGVENPSEHGVNIPPNGQATLTTKIELL